MTDVRRSEAADGFLRDRYRALLLGVLALGAVLRVAAHLSLAASDPVFGSPSVDSMRFLDWAGDIAAGDLFGDKVFFLNPLYPYFLAPLVKLFGPMLLGAIRVVQMLLGMGTVLLVAATARRLLGAGVALGAALVAAAWPLLLYYEQYVMIVTLAVFLNTLTLFLLARAAARPGLRPWLPAGVALGLALLARPNVGLFAVLLPVWLLAVAPEGSRIRFAAARTGVLALGAVLMVAPVTIRNAAVSGDFVMITSSGGLNLWLANNPAARETGRHGAEGIRSNPALMERDAARLASAESGRDLDPSEVSSFFAARAIEEARAHPGPTLRYLGQKLLMFLRSYEIPSSYHFWAQRRETPLLRLLPLSFGLLSPFALLGLAVVLLRRRDALPLALLYLCYLVGLTIITPIAHYRAPVLPAAIPLGVFGLATLGAPLLDRRFGAAVRPAVVVAVGALLAFAGPIGRLAGVSLIREKPEDEVVFWFNRGHALLARGREAEAKAAFEAALAADPDSSVPYTGLALVARVEKDLEGERRRLEEALARKPGDPATRISLARNRFDRGERREALEEAMRIVAEVPGDGTVLANTALMLVTEKRYREAYELFVRAEDSGVDRMQVILDECRCLGFLGELRKVLATADRGLALNPDYAPLHFVRARALMALRAPRRDVAAAIRAGLATGAALPKDLRGNLR